MAIRGPHVVGQVGGQLHHGGEGVPQGVGGLAVVEAVVVGGGKGVVEEGGEAGVRLGETKTSLTF